MGRGDLTSLTGLVAAILLLVGMAWAMAAEPVEQSSVCRSRAGDAARDRVVRATPVAPRLKTTPPS